MGGPLDEPPKGPAEATSVHLPPWGGGGTMRKHLSPSAAMLQFLFPLDSGEVGLYELSSEVFGV